MKLTIKFAPILILLLLASPLILLKGCGKALNGGSSGACPDTVAPSGSKILTPTLGAPFITSNSFFCGIGFTVTDSNDVPMNGICVVVTTDASIALTTETDCASGINDPKTTIVTRTNDYGQVILDLVTAPTPSGQTHFVEVSSGALSAIATTAPAK